MLRLIAEKLRIMKEYKKFAVFTVLFFILFATNTVFEQEFFDNTFSGFRIIRNSNTDNVLFFRRISQRDEILNKYGIDIAAFQDEYLEGIEIDKVSEQTFITSFLKALGYDYRDSEDKIDVETIYSFLKRRDLGKVDSPKKFVVYSGPSGVGEGTLYSGLLEKYPGLFERFVLYATRGRRYDLYSEQDSLFPALKEYLESHIEVREIPDINYLVYKYGLNEEQRKKLDKIINPDWNVILDGAPRKDIPDIKERMVFQDENHNQIRVYNEFWDAPYNFVDEIPDDGTVIIARVRTGDQGLDLKEAEEKFKSDKIVVLEARKVLADGLVEQFPDVHTIFISPLSDEEIKSRIVEKLKEWQSQFNEVSIANLNINEELEGGLDRHLAEVVEGFSVLDVILQENLRTAVAFSILRSTDELNKWNQDAKLGLSDFQIEQVKQVVESLNTVKKALVAVVMEEMATRLIFRFESQGKNPEDLEVEKEIFLRISQSPGEIAERADSKSVVVNKWGYLDESIKTFAHEVMLPLFKEIIEEEQISYMKLKNINHNQLIEILERIGDDFIINP